MMGYQDEGGTYRQPPSYDGNYGNNSYDQNNSGVSSHGNYGDGIAGNFNNPGGGNYCGPSGSDNCGNDSHNFGNNNNIDNNSSSSSRSHSSRYHEDNQRDHDNRLSRKERSPPQIHDEKYTPPRRTYDDYLVNPASSATTSVTAARDVDSIPRERRSRDDHRDSREYSRRDRRRSRSRSRDRSRRSRSRSRNRSRERRRGDRSPSNRYRSGDNESREKSRYREDRDRDEDHNSNRSSSARGGREDTLLPPSSTVIIQSLHLDATEKDIEAVLKEDGCVAKNVSVIRERNSESRGFAFVDFDSEAQAEQWLLKRQRALVILGQRSSLNFSKNKRNSQDQNVQHAADWTCSECNSLNFGSRNKITDKVFICYKCRIVRKEGDGNEADNPKNKDSACNVLMLRGMAYSTEEEKIRAAISRLTNKVLYDVRLIRDKVTDLSRGFAFVELASTEDATELLDIMGSLDPPLEIDGCRLSYGYARHGLSSNKKPTSGHQNNRGSISKDTVAKNAMAQATAANASASEFSQNVTGTYPPSSAKEAPASGAMALHNVMRQGFTYDPASGYYYDSNSGLYYDSTTGYYYNGTTGQWLQWDGTQYHVINQDGTVAGGQQKQQQPLPQQPTTPGQNALAFATDQQQQQTPETLTLGGQKPKSARKIAKDMERWAKKFNSQSETKKAAVKQAQEELRALEQKEEELRKKIHLEKTITSNLAQIASSKDGIRSLFVPDDDEGSVLKLGSALSVPTTVNKSRNVSLVADYPLDDDEEDDDVIVDERMFVDLTKMACLLCQRQLTSQENLNKHLQKSQLHKQNLEKFKESKKKKR